MILLSLAAKTPLIRNIVKHLPQPAFHSPWNQIAFYFFNWIKLNDYIPLLTLINNWNTLGLVVRPHFIPTFPKISGSNPGICIFFLFFLQNSKSQFEIFQICRYLSLVFDLIFFFSLNFFARKKHTNIRLFWKPIQKFQILFYIYYIKFTDQYIYV